MPTTVSAHKTCPSWCAGEHLPTWRLHTRTIGTVRNPFTNDHVDIEIHKHDEHGEPHISLALVEGNDETITTLTPTTGAAIADILRTIGEAGVLADALHEASDTIEAALDTSWVGGGDE